MLLVAFSVSTQSQWRCLSACCRLCWRGWCWLCCLSAASRNGCGPCSAGDGCSTRREPFQERGMGTGIHSGRLEASLEKKVSTKQRNARCFLSLSKTGLKQAVLLMYSDILTSCAESGKSSHLFFFLGYWLQYLLEWLDNVFIPQPGLTLVTPYTKVCPCFWCWSTQVYKPISLGYRGDFWGLRGIYLLSCHWGFVGHRRWPGLWAFQNKPQVSGEGGRCSHFYTGG